MHSPCGAVDSAWVAVKGFRVDQRVCGEWEKVAIDPENEEGCIPVGCV